MAKKPAARSSVLFYSAEDAIRFLDYLHENKNKKIDPARAAEIRESVKMLNSIMKKN